MSTAVCFMLDVEHAMTLTQLWDSTKSHRRAYLKWVNHTVRELHLKKAVVIT